MSVGELKAQLRRELARVRAAVGGREARSAAICELIGALPAFQAARAIHCYLPMRSEVDVRPLIRAALGQGKGVVVPVTVPGAAELRHAWIADLEPASFVRGPLGTPVPREERPAAVGDWQLVVVPLLGFNRRGFRVGYGGGYYDRLLAVDRAVSVGAAFAAQEVGADFVEAHDQPLAMVATEDGLIVP